MKFLYKCIIYGFLVSFSLSFLLKNIVFLVIYGLLSYITLLDILSHVREANKKLKKDIEDAILDQKLFKNLSNYEIRNPGIKTRAIKIR